MIGRACRRLPLTVADAVATEFPPHICAQMSTGAHLTFFDGLRLPFAEVPPSAADA